MISHKHKCIFIHVSKCAGSSIEKAFGIDIVNTSESNNKQLFGWNKTHQLFLQHATPQELIDLGFITRDIWDKYYKFIVVRNPWSRSLSDYFWTSKYSKIKDSFSNFILKKGKFKDVLCDNSTSKYKGDHLTPQVSYFNLDGQRINYNTIIKFETIHKGLKKVINDLHLEDTFFEEKVNTAKKKFDHYSHFYNHKRKQLVETIYKEDIEFLNYHFEEKKSSFKKITVQMPSQYYLP